MPAYKDQHWLPSAYLKYFSLDQQDCTRKSLTWRLDGKTERCVPVESQCSADYFYSKVKAAETEQMFQINENAYCDCVDRIRTQRELVDRNLGDLLLAMFDFHLRNAAHKNQIGKEGIEAYSRRVDIFIGQILLGREDEAITKLDIKSHLENYWRIRIISAPSGHQFVTSDHPAVWRTLGQVSIDLKTKLHLIALPIGPKSVAIGFDKRVADIVSYDATSKDVGILNASQIENSEKCLYMSHLLPPEQMAFFQECFSKKPASQSEIIEEGWKFPWYTLRPDRYFSFMRLRPLAF
jgi:hypothetical protein